MLEGKIDAVPVVYIYPNLDPRQSIIINPSYGDPTGHPTPLRKTGNLSQHKKPRSPRPTQESRDLGNLGNLVRGNMRAGKVGGDASCVELSSIPA